MEEDSEDKWGVFRGAGGTLGEGVEEEEED